MSKNMKNNMGSMNAGGDISDSSIKLNKSNNNNVDKSTTSLTKIYNNNIKEPKRMSKEERKKQMEETMRPHLKDRVGNHITVFAFITGKYRNYENRFTIINLLDINTNRFVADHIQIDLNPNIFDYSKAQGSFVKISGIVKPYDKNGGEDYTIKVSEKVEILCSEFNDLGNVIKYDSLTQTDIETISKMLKECNMTDMYDMIEEVREKINDITADMFGEDYLYNYTLCQYFLNQAVYNIYNGELRDQGFNEDMVVEIFVILCNLLTILTYTDSISLNKSLFAIVQFCNIYQGVETYEDYKKNKGFIEFCNKKLGITGNRKIKYIWNNFVIWRSTNFNNVGSNIIHFNKKLLIRNAFIIIKYFMCNKQYFDSIL